MQACLITFALLVGQLGLHSKPVVHLPPHREYIASDYGGKLLELIDAPALLSLPTAPPRRDARGNPWTIDIRNFGPHTVTIMSRGGFRIAVNVGQTVHIAWNGASYFRAEAP